MIISRHFIIAITVLLLSQALPAFSQEADDLFTCEGLIGLTYSVRVPLYGNVCYEFISSDMYTETYETVSLDEQYNVLSQDPCVIQLGVNGLSAGCQQVQFSENGELLYGECSAGIRILVFFPIWGHRVHQPECVPGRLLLDTQYLD